MGGSDVTHISSNAAHLERMCRGVVSTAASCRKAYRSSGLASDPPCKSTWNEPDFARMENCRLVGVRASALRMVALNCTGVEDALVFIRYRRRMAFLFPLRISSSSEGDCRKVPTSIQLDPPISASTW